MFAPENRAHWIASINSTMSFDCESRANCIRAAFAGADSNALIHGQHENLAVADLARVAAACSTDDSVDSRFDECVVDRDLHLELGNQALFDFLTAIDFSKSSLLSESATVADGHQINIVMGEH